jgi:UPF0755 protein
MTGSMTGDGPPEGLGREGAPPDGVPAAAPRGGDRRMRRRRRRRVLLLIAGIGFVAILGLVAWYELQANPFGGPGPKVVLTIADNESAGSTIDALAHDGVVASAFAFRLSDIIHGTPTVTPGSYLFHQNQSFSTVRSILAGGPDVFSVDVLPGLSLSEVSQRVADLPIAPKGSFVDALKDGSVTSTYSPAGSGSLEGLIGTGEYQVLPGETSVQLLTQMLDRFNVQAASLHLTQGAAALGITPAQLVIVASIVEKEGYIDKNMGKVSRVVYNRLADGTPLQMDSTVLYSLGQDGGTVSAADLQDNTPYNTYIHTGLTPTAICVPSKTALIAAAHPTPGQWLYFELVDKNGTEQFSDTYAEQLAAEQLAAARGLP